MSLSLFFVPPHFFSGRQSRQDATPACPLSRHFQARGASFPRWTGTFAYYCMFLLRNTGHQQGQIAPQRCPGTGQSFYLSYTGLLIARTARKDKFVPVPDKFVQKLVPEVFCMLNEDWLPFLIWSSVLLICLSLALATGELYKRHLRLPTPG